MTKYIQLRTLCTPLFVIASIIACSSSFAVTMDVTVGFNGVLKSSVWTPITLQLTNSSSEDVQGEIILSDANGNMNQMTICTTEVNLPAKSQKLYHSYVRLTGYGGEFVVTLADGRSIMARKQVNLNMASTEDRVIVTVGNRSSRLGFLQGETIKITPAAPPPGSYSSGSGRNEAALFAGSLDSKLLPDRPAAYEGANIIVLSELTPAAVNPNALKAIGMWVASGGTLVIPTGADSKRFTDPFYTDLLPVTINGAANITGSTDMAALGKAAFPAGACAVASSSVKPGIGRLIASAGAVPLIVERAYGAGRVIFIAFDIKSSPFRDWNGQTEFWKNIIRMPTSQPMVDSIRTLPDQNRYNYYGGQSPYASMGMMEAVAQNPSVKMPSFNTIGLFLLGYIIILVPVNYFLLKKKRRLELAWVTTPLIVIAFTLGAYTIGYTMKGGDLQLREAVVIEGSSGARFARMVSNATLFSPARRSYDVSIDDPSAISQVVATEANESTPVAYLGEKSTIPDVGMAMWSSKTFEAVGGADLGGALNSRLMLSANKLIGEIKNETKVPFKNCVVSYNNAQQDLGALNPGDSVKVDMNLLANGRARFGSSELDQKLDDNLNAKAMSAAGPVLIGVPAKDTKIIDLPNNTLKASRAVRYIFRLDYAVAGFFKLSEQSISGQIIEIDNGQAYNQNMSKQAGELLIENVSPKTKTICMFRLPVPAGGKITSLHIRETPINSNFSCSFYNCTTSKWEPFKMGTGITISNAAKYVGASNEVRLKAVNTSTDYRSIRLRLSAQGASL
jgi:hypothetical protein